MAFDGTGTYNRVHDWTTDRDAAIKINAERVDEEDDGYATGLTSCICKDGQSTTTARIPFAQGISFNIGSAATPAISPAGDGNTGIYSSAGDHLSIAAGGNLVGEFRVGGLDLTGGTLTDQSTVLGITVTQPTTIAAAQNAIH